MLAGRPDEAISVADGLLPQVEQSGDVWAAYEAAVYRAFAAVEQGHADAGTAERMVRLARKLRASPMTCSSPESQSRASTGSPMAMWQ